MTKINFHTFVIHYKPTLSQIFLKSYIQKSEAWFRLLAFDIAVSC